MQVFHRLLAAGVFASACIVAQAQSCAGGLFLNPEMVRGELAAQTDAALRELVEFLKPSGLSVTPVTNIRDELDVARELKRAQPPCWIYGNPVVGLASGYRPAIVNHDPIVAAVLVVAEAGAEKAPKPVDLHALAPVEQQSVLAKLKQTECFGVKGGVTTALVKAENLCGKVTELPPQQGLGQSFLVVKAAFAWRPERWVGLITRDQSARKATMADKIGADPHIVDARLVVVPAAHPSWGYGLYVSEEAHADAVHRAVQQFSGLAGARPALLKALDVGAKAKFTTPSAEEVQAMRGAIRIDAH